MADPAGTKIVEEPKNVQTDHPVVSDTRRHPEEAEKRAKPSVVPYNPGKSWKRPSRIKVQPVSGSLQELRNLLTFLKMPEQLLAVIFIVINVFGRFVMKLNLADPSFADFRSNSANTVYFC